MSAFSRRPVAVVRMIWTGQIATAWAIQRTTPKMLDTRTAVSGPT